VTDEILEVKPPPPNDKELKSDKTEKDEKDEIKELKEFKHDKDEKEKEDTELGNKLSFESFPSRESLLAHAEALEQTARALRHFIEQSERPDLRRGALRREADEEDRG
jgi:hypothetical protein